MAAPQQINVAVTAPGGSPRELSQKNNEQLQYRNGPFVNQIVANGIPSDTKLFLTTKNTIVIIIIIFNKLRISNVIL